MGLTGNPRSTCVRNKQSPDGATMGNDGATPQGQWRVLGIGLLEVFWKLLTSIIYVRMKESTTLHNSLHGFRAKQGTGTAIFEAKLFQQLATVFEVFLEGGRHA